MKLNVSHKKGLITYKLNYKKRYLLNEKQVFVIVLNKEMLYKDTYINNFLIYY